MKLTGWKQWTRTIVLTSLFAFFAMTKVFAEGPPKPSQLDNALAISLLVVAGALLLAIVMLGRLLINVATVRTEQELEQKKAAVPSKALLILFLCSVSYMSFAEDVTTAATTQSGVTSIGGLSTFSFYTIISVIVLEILVITSMLFSLKRLLAKEKAVIVETVQEPSIPLWRKWWIKLNSFKPAHEETDTGHDYDGIHELDNRLPPWWLYGFYLCIIFSIVYLYRSHVSHSAPSSEQEYLTAVAKAAVEKEEYLKKAANKVDENTVTLLTDATALEEGKKIFNATCAPCHGPEGQGVVGPNLTDDYWLHKGGIKDVFKVIKYGVPEKGMKAWEADFSPVQIAALASYIKSIHGTKPANPKEPQGDLYNEQEPAATDSLKTVTVVQ